MRIIAIAAALLVTACATVPPEPASPQDAFYNRLLSLCGQSFEGRIVSPITETDSDFAGRRLVMHVRDCSPNRA
jgi:hypothetical protein